MNNIILVGFMGTGKSAVGKLLARRLNRPFLDLDRKIEKETGRSVQEIFAREGEAAFRRLEAKAVREVAALKKQVIATGGGVMGDEKNVQALKASGVLVCLTASPDVILERTSEAITARPLLAPLDHGLTGPAGGNPKERIETLLKLRAPYYAQADLTIDTSNRPLQEIADEILCKLETFKSSR